MGRSRSCKCPVCSFYINESEFTEIGEGIFCGECGESLKVISIRPPRVKMLNAKKKQSREFDDEDDINEEF